MLVASAFIVPDDSAGISPASSVFTMLLPNGWKIELDTFTAAFGVGTVQYTTTSTGVLFSGIARLTFTAAPIFEIH
jgi:hypothetical protein